MQVNDVDWIVQPHDRKGKLAISNVRYFESGTLKEDGVVAVVSVFGEKDLPLPE